MRLFCSSIVLMSAEKSSDISIGALIAAFAAALGAASSPGFLVDMRSTCLRTAPSLSILCKHGEFPGNYMELLLCGFTPNRSGPATMNAPCSAAAAAAAAAVGCQTAVP
jgi:hypothetical protein